MAADAIEFTVEVDNAKSVSATPAAREPAPELQIIDRALASEIAGCKTRAWSVFLPNQDGTTSPPKGKAEELGSWFIVAAAVSQRSLNAFANYGARCCGSAAPRFM